MTASQNTFGIRSNRVVTPGGVRSATVVVRGERIDTVVDPADVAAGVSVEDLGDAAISPGLVDAHVHINEPGRTEWEGFATATAAAVAGGVTTLVDMPLNSTPVTTTAGALEEKRRAATAQCRVDVGFYGGVVPGSESYVAELVEAGVLGVKAFLCDSGLPEFPAATVSELNAVMPMLAQKNVPLLVHCELDDGRAPLPPNTRNYNQFRDSRPDEWEVAAIRLMIDLCRQHRCRVHVVHLSSAQALELIRAAKAEGLPLTVETCPHYLFFTDEDVAEGDTRFKCAPPIRSADNRRMLWEALRSGLIDTIASDHSPCPPEMKALDTGDFATAWGGISSLQLTLSAVWTAGQEYGITLEDLTRWRSRNPAKFLGLENKGQLAAGYDADLVVWDPEQEWTVTPESLHHRHKLTPYEGRTFKGVVQRTYLRGRLVYQDGELIGPPTGRLLERITV